MPEDDITRGCIRDSQDPFKGSTSKLDMQIGMLTPVGDLFVEIFLPERMTPPEMSARKELSDSVHVCSKYKKWAGTGLGKPTSHYFHT